MPVERRRPWLARPSTLVVLLGAGVVTVAAVRHLRGGSLGHQVPGGILIADTGFYDTMTRLALGSFYAGVAGNVATVAPKGARVLEVGCGPGHLSIALARDHGLDVTGLDLDPAMIERARANAERRGAGRQPSFVVGDAGSLGFPDGSFDVVVSTLSVHHWTDPTKGLAEIGRVLRPDGQALVWDIRPGAVPLHRGLPDPAEHVRASALRVVSVTPWRWPWRLRLTQRLELARSDEGPGRDTGTPTGVSS